MVKTSTFRSARISEMSSYSFFRNPQIYQMKKNLLLLSVCLSLCMVNAYAQDRSMAEITGAKMQFSNTPLLASADPSKAGFTSGEFIYARMDLGGKSLKDAFGLVPQKSGYYYLRVWVLISQDGESFGSHHQWESMWVRDADINKTALSFDLLPEPSKANTVICGTEQFNSTFYPGAMHLMINEDNFPTDGKYFVRVKVFMKAYDAYGKLTDYDKWPCVTGNFEYDFKTSDVANIIQNRQAAQSTIEKIIK